MTNRTLAILILLGAAAASCSAAEADPEQIFQEAWYQETGLRNLQAALDVYKRIVEDHMDRRDLAARAQVRIIECHKRLGQFNLAKRALLDAYRQFPDEMKKHPKLLVELERIEKRFSDAFDGGGTFDEREFVQRFLGQVDFQTAYNIFQSFRDGALEARYDDPAHAISTMRNAIAIGSFLLGDRREEKDLRGSVTDAQLFIGDVFAKSRKFEPAIEAYREAQAEFPEETERLAWAQMKIAECFRRLGVTDAATSAYEKVLTEYPAQRRQQSWSLLWLGDLHRENDRLQSAMRVWETVATEYEDQATRAQASLAKFLLGRGGPPETPRVAPSLNNDFAYFMGTRYQMLGEKLKAREQFQKCVGSSVGNDWPYELAERALRADDDAAAPDRPAPDVAEVGIAAGRNVIRPGASEVGKR